MYIEDIISELVFQRISLNSYDTKLVYSLHDQVCRHSGLTEKQSILAVRIAKRYSNSLATAIGKNIDTFLENPTFRMPIRKISSEKSLSIVNYTPFQRAIKAVFPYNEKLVETIRKNRDNIGQANWDKDEKCWFFALNEKSLQFLLSLDTFLLDEQIQDYQKQIELIEQDIENHVPMIIIENSRPKLKNCHKNTPDLESNDLISSVFEARKRGVYTWDEKINNFIENSELNSLTRAFLKTDPSEKFGVDSETYEISEISTIIFNLLPVLVIIPGGDELNSMKLSLDFFKNIGIERENMSVMFRLPSNTHQIFNEFVKFNELNSPINNFTKVVFVSSKIPKPIFKSGIKFHSILNLGYSNVHYTMRDFVKTHENSILYSKEKDIKNLRYGFV